jgi:hypothetical protein
MFLTRATINPAACRGPEADSRQPDPRPRVTRGRNSHSRHHPHRHRVPAEAAGTGPGVAARREGEAGPWLAVINLLLDVRQLRTVMLLDARCCECLSIPWFVVFCLDACPPIPRAADG